MDKDSKYNYGHKIDDRPFLSSFQPLFQSEFAQTLCYEYQFFNHIEIRIITITKILHLDSL